MAKVMEYVFKRLNLEVDAMALPRGKVKDLAIALARPINEHLMKCYLSTTEHPSWNHWIKEEITSWLNKLATTICKNNKKPLEASVLQEILLSGDLDSPDNLKKIEKYIADKESLEIKKETAQKLWERFKNFYAEICPLLEKGNVISSDQIQKLILKHFH